METSPSFINNYSLITIQRVKQLYSRLVNVLVLILRDLKKVLQRFLIEKVQHQIKHWIYYCHIGFDLRTCSYFPI